MKAPFNPDSLLSGRPFPAKASISNTWSSYQNAAECVERGLAIGIGYEFDGSGIYGVGLDHVIDENGVTPQAREIVGNLSSYSEISPSGTGLHVFVLAPDADISRHRKKDSFIEIYTEARYFTVTGNLYGYTRIIESRASELQMIYDKYLLSGTAQKTAAYSHPAAVQSNSEQERFLRTGLERDKNFASLWEGERRHGNESADDQALMNKLAYWCSADIAAMLKTFMQSPYYSGKDDAHMKKCQRNDYLINTAKNACATVYSTAQADYERWQSSRRQKSMSR